MASKRVQRLVKLILDKYPDAKECPPGILLPAFIYISLLEKVEKEKHESRSI